MSISRWAGNRRRPGQGSSATSLIVWLLTGIWHGAGWNFVVWGVYFGILLVLEKLFLLRWLKRLPAVLRHIYALALVTISWQNFFAFTEISKGAAWCKAMFSGVPFDSGSLYLLLTYGPMLAICALAATPLGKRFYEKDRHTAGAAGADRG